MTYLKLHGSAITQIAYVEPKDSAGWIAYEGEMPEAKEGYHLEYKGGKVVAVDDRIEQVSALRKAAYIERVDPITAEIERLKEMGGAPEELEAARYRRAEEVAAIKAEYPYPEEDA